MISRRQFLNRTAAAVLAADTLAMVRELKGSPLDMSIGSQRTDVSAEDVTNL